MVEEEAADFKYAVMEEKIIGTESVTLDEHGQGAVTPKGLPSPARMTPAAERLHWLTHLPYNPACEVCVRCKRPNTHHRGCKTDSRVIPLLVGDYCFLKDSQDEDQATMLVLKLYPYKIYFACLVRQKGPDPLVVARLTQFIKDMGLEHFAYRSDKEPAIISMLEEACARASRRGVKVKSDEDTETHAAIEDDLPLSMLDSCPPRAPTGTEAMEGTTVAVPEHSHPSESQ